MYTFYFSCIPGVESKNSLRLKYAEPAEALPLPDSDLTKSIEAELGQLSSIVDRNPEMESKINAELQKILEFAKSSSADQAQPTPAKLDNDIGLIVEDLNDLPQERRASVLFVVRDESRERALAIITAIKEVHNIWLTGPAQEHESQYVCGSAGNYIRPHNNWRSDLQDIYLDNDANLSYVYSYASPLNYDEWLDKYCDSALYGHEVPKAEEVRPFYIGMGQGGRWLDHISIAMPYISLKNIPKGSDLEYGKVLKIYEHLLKRANLVSQELVRKIAIFVGEYAQEKAFAVEHFLINFYGIYSLTNLTNGNMTIGSAEFIARPKHCKGGEEWTKIVAEFSKIGLKAYTQKRANHLKVFELNEQYPHFLIDEGEISPYLKRFDDASSKSFITNGKDIYCPLKIIDAKAKPKVRVDLKMSAKNPSFAINLRPMPGLEAEFPMLIAQAFFDGKLESVVGGNSSRIKDLANEPFFKPCAANSDGNKDVWFNFAELDRNVYQVIDCPWLGHGNNWNDVSFKEVLQTIVAKFQ